MSEGAQIILACLAGAGLILAAGMRMATLADQLSYRLGLGHAFVGMVLIGWTTSLPEMILTIGSLVAPPSGVPQPAMGIGNITGSVIFNLAILGLMDLFYRHGSVWNVLHKNLGKSGQYSLALIALAWLAFRFSQGHTLAGLDYWSLVILLAYCFVSWRMYLNDKQNPLDDAAGQDDKQSAPQRSLSSLSIEALMAMLVIVASGLWLSRSADALAHHYQLSSGMVGTFFLATISSLPELVTTYAAVRLGAPAMAVGSLFGSNIFNITIFVAADLVYQQGSLFSSLADHPVATKQCLLTLGLGLLMTVVGIFSLGSSKKQGCLLNLGLPSLILLGIYAVGATWLVSLKVN